MRRCDGHFILRNELLWEMYQKSLYVRKNALKIPINNGNFTKKKIHF